MKHIQFILNEIARRYDQGYADHIWTATQIKFAADYASSMEEDGGLLQLVALYRVMDEEGFSHSERGAILNSDGVLTTENTITMDTTFVGMFAKGNLVRINYSELHGEGNNVELAIQDNSVNPLNPRWGNTWIDGGIRTMSDPDITFVYSQDNVTLHATEKSGYTFLGWFNGNELISNAKDLHVSAITKDVNLTPVYEQKKYYYVWFDGSNGAFRGTHAYGRRTVHDSANTMYTTMQIINTLNRKPVSFGKKWVNPSQQGQQWVRDGSGYAPIYMTLTRTRQPATDETLEEGATQVVETLLSGQAMVYDTTDSVTIAEKNHTVTWVDNTTDYKLIENGYVYMFSISDLEKYAYVNNEAKPWTYTLTEDRVGPVPGRLFRTSYETSGQNYAEEGEYIVNIEENTFELPSTGGRGTGMFYILGSILTVLAAVLLIAKKRSDAAGID